MSTTITQTPTAKSELKSKELIKRLRTKSTTTKRDVFYIPVASRIRMVHYWSTYARIDQMRNSWRQLYGKKNVPSYRSFVLINKRFDETGSVLHYQNCGHSTKTVNKYAVYAREFKKLMKKDPTRKFSSVCKEWDLLPEVLSKALRENGIPNISDTNKEVRELRTKIKELEKKRDALKRKQLEKELYNRIKEPPRGPITEIIVPKTSVKSIRAKIQQFSYPLDYVNATEHSTQDAEQEKGENTEPSISTSDDDNENDEGEDEEEPINDSEDETANEIEDFLRQELSSDEFDQSKLDAESDEMDQD